MPARPYERRLAAASGSPGVLPAVNLAKILRISRCHRVCLPAAGGLGPRLPVTAAPCLRTQHFNHNNNNAVHHSSNAAARGPGGGMQPGSLSHARAAAGCPSRPARRRRCSTRPARRRNSSLRLSQFNDSAESLKKARARLGRARPRRTLRRRTVPGGGRRPGACH